MNRQFVGRTFLLAAVVAITATDANAQLIGRRARGSTAWTASPVQVAYGPQLTGTVAAEPLGSATVPAVGTRIGCPCGSIPSGACDDHCESPPKITKTNNDCNVVRDCSPINVDITPIGQPDCVNVPFYGTPKKFQGTVEVPVISEVSRKEIKFKTIEIPLPCCTVTVCVQCEKCYVKTKECNKQRKKIDLEAYRRQDGTIDVYGLGVPGMPTKYVERQKITEADYKTYFGSGAPVPMYP